MASHHLDNDSSQDNKHFDRIIIGNHGNKPLELDESPFADITFNRFYGFNIKFNENNPFGKAAQTIKHLNLILHINHQPPKNDVWKLLNTLVNVERIQIDLNITEIPSKALNLRNLNSIQIRTQNSITIKRNSFYNVDHLKELRFRSQINKVENEAFASKSSSVKLEIKFDDVVSNAFQSDSFKGLQRPVQIRFNSLQHLPESSFKIILDNQNQIRVDEINCKDCRNHWLIEDQRDGQVSGVNCNKNGLKLFDNKSKSFLNRVCLKGENITLVHCNQTNSLDSSNYLVSILIMFSLFTFLNYF